VTLAEALKQAPAGVVRLVADHEGGAMPGLREGDAVQWLIGPEGGFSPSELALIRSAGFRPVALSRATLRFDTAAAAAVAVTAMAREKT
jgi:RsmE family RNA methyltransferase